MNVLIAKVNLISFYQFILLMQNYASYNFKYLITSESKKTYLRVQEPEIFQLQIKILKKYQFLKKNDGR